ncbi:unnamed protein product, partial [Chrysoparadoxa australica]
MASGRDLYCFNAYHPRGDVQAVLRGYQERSGKFRVCYPDGNVIQGLQEIDFTWLDNTKWECGWISQGSMRDHLQNKCNLRLRECKNKCGQVIMQKQMEHHLREGCLNRFVSCQCGEDVRSKDLDTHLESTCSLRKVSCDLCGVPVVHSGLEEHRKLLCSRRRILCRLGCGAVLCKEEEQVHCKEACPKRPVPCPQECGDGSIWAEELELHINQYCPNSSIPCRLCGKKVIVSSMEEHCKEICGCREVTCECGEKHLAKAKEEHRIASCQAVQRYCSLGCGVSLRQMDMAQHQDSDCKRKALKNLGKLTDCALGCGQLILRQFEFQHRTFDCPKRPLRCGFGCGMNIPAEDQDMHRLTCGARVIRCGADSAGCERKLYTWLGITQASIAEWRQSAVSREPPKPGALPPGPSEGLAMCSDHGSNMLLWAATHEDESELVSEVIRLTGGKGIDAESALGDTALTVACARGHLEVVKVLVEGHADVNYETRVGKTPLMEAARHDQPHVIRFLLQNQAASSYRNSRGQTAQWWAQRLGYARCLTELKRRKAAESTLRTMFSHICRGDLQSVMGLVENGEPYRFNHEAMLEEELLDFRDQYQKAKERLLQLRQEKANEGCDVAALQLQLAEAEEQHKEMEKQAASCRGEEGAITVHTFSDAADAALAGFRESLSQLQRVCMEDARAVVESCRLADLAEEQAPAEVVRVLHGTLVMLGFSCVELDGDGVSGGDSSARDVKVLELSLPMLLNGSLLHRARHLEQRRVTPEVVDKVRAVLSGPSGEREVEWGQGTALVLVKALGEWLSSLAACDRLKRPHLDGALSQALTVKHEWEAVVIRIKEAQLGLHLEEFRSHVLRSELEEAEGEARVLKQKVTWCEERLQVATLFSLRSASGHSLMSWAAACGQAEITDLLLEHGGTPGYGDEYLNLCARVVQSAYRHRLWVRKITSNWDQQNSKLLFRRNMAHAMTRASLGKKMRDHRWTQRLPLPEACYAGWYQVIQMYRLRGVKLNNTTTTFLHPMPPPPAPLLGNGGIHNYQLRAGQEMSIVDCCEAGARNMRCKVWLHGNGWMDETDPINRQTISASVANSMWREVQTVRLLGKEEKERRSHVRAKKRKEEMLYAGMLSSPKPQHLDHNCPPQILALCADGASIDYEAPNGYTALIKATEVVETCKNQEGWMVHACQLLVDRRSHRPKLDYLSKGKGHTALSWACCMGRVQAVEILLDRGAKLDRPTGMRGRTPLITASMAGHADVARMLLERGADPLLEDAEGKNTWDHARE